MRYIWKSSICLGLNCDKSKVNPAVPIIVAAYGTIKTGAEIDLKDW